eukprot:5935846-Amphidinium_carterae.1
MSHSIRRAERLESRSESKVEVSSRSRCCRDIPVSNWEKLEDHKAPCTSDATKLLSHVGSSEK